MWHTEHTLETTSRPEDIWQRWSQVERWPEWDESLDRASLRGPLAPGSEAVVKRRGCSLRTFRIVAVKDGEELVCQSRSLWSDWRMIHRQEATAMGTRITQRIEVHGLSAWLVGATLGRRLKDALPPAVRKLARLAGQD